MAENVDKESNNQPTFDPNIQTEDLAFSPDEMIACGCGRMNPPNRLNCIYCGRTLNINFENSGPIKVNARPLELWERGFNVAFTGVCGGSPPDAGAIASYLSRETEIVEAMLAMGTPLPVARVEGEKDALVLQSELERLGLVSTIVRDSDLAAEKPPVRLSGIVFETGSLGLRAFNTGEITSVLIDDLVVLVSGAVTKGRTDAVEKKRRRGNTELIDETSTMTDEAVLDIYARSHPLGFRVQLAGFDFSCLGSHKGLIAAENIVKLIASLQEHAPDARFVNEYQKVKHALGGVWEIDIRKAPTGMHRIGFAKREFGSVTSTSNLDQFTKYSRLQRHIYEAQR